LAKTAFRFLVSAKENTVKTKNICQKLSENFGRKTRPGHFTKEENCGLEFSSKRRIAFEKNPAINLLSLLRGFFRGDFRQKPRHTLSSPHDENLCRTDLILSRKFLPALLVSGRRSVWRCKPVMETTPI
jgi:hypothetical protein